MALSFKQYEIDHHVLKLIVGLIALSLANLAAFFSPVPIESISASYHQGGWARDIFVGFLYAISAFLLAYNGSSASEMILSKIAGFTAIGVAMFPCACGSHDEIIPYVHNGSAGVMFLILAIFCWIFYKRARAKKRRQANWRACIYAVCGILLVLSIAVLGLDELTGGYISSKVDRLVFYGERVGLMAFGISWLVASRALPVITAVDERVAVLPFTTGTTGAH
jgi:hypothetical protein